MPRIQKKKKNLLSSLPSPHVINLRAAAEAETMVADPEIERPARRTLASLFFSYRRTGQEEYERHGDATGDFLAGWQRERTRSVPRVDLAHGMQFTHETHTREEEIYHVRDYSRWGRAFHDLALVEMLRSFGLGTFFRSWSRTFPSIIPPTFRPTFAIQSAVVFAVIAIFLVLPFGVVELFGQVRQASAALTAQLPSLVLDGESLVQAVREQRWGDAGALARKLEEHFTTLDTIVDTNASLLVRALRLVPIVGDAVVGGQGIVESGVSASRDLKALFTLLDERGTLHDPRLVHDIAPIAEHLTETIAAFRADMSRVSALMPHAAEGVSPALEHSIDRLVPEAVRVNHGVQLLDAALGFDTPRRYLILFQNPHELRATGGFLGSYAILDIANGRVTRWTIPPEGTYGLQGNLTTQYRSPAPLHLVNPRWEFQDANWWPDWPTTAEKILWFWEKSGQPTVDGVLAVNGVVLEDILEATGPLTLPSGNGVITSRSILRFIEETIVGERRAQHREQPKRILGALAERLIDRMSTITSEERSRIFSILLDRLERRDLMLYSRVPALSSHIHALAWDGSITTTARDALMVVHSNIRGEKTDAVMENALEYNVFVQPDGMAVATLTVERTHHGAQGDVLTGSPNVDYVRMYVPEGATLIDAWGWQAPAARLFEEPLPLTTDDPDIVRIEGVHTQDARTGVDMYHEQGRTVFAHWLITRPGARSIAGIRYLLPFRLIPGEKKGFLEEFISTLRNDPAYIPYDVQVFRQPGTTSTLRLSVTTPATWESVWRYPGTLETTPATMRYAGELAKDIWIGAVWKQ